MDLLLTLTKEPAITMSLIVLIGLLLQKKPLSNIIQGILATVIGFTLIKFGGILLNEPFSQFQDLFRKQFQIDGIFPTNEGFVGLIIGKIGVHASWIFIGGMVVHFMIARYTKFKIIYLSGHNAFFMAILFAILFSEAKYPLVVLIVAGSILLGLFLSFSPAVIQPYVQKVTQDKQIAIGHNASTGYWVASVVAKLFQKKYSPTQKQENKLSLSLLFELFQNFHFSMILSTFLIFALVSFHANLQKHWLIFSLQNAVIITASLVILIQGVKMFLAEIIPSFQGISQKLIPGAKPALDVTTLFTYHPSIISLGFSASFAGGILALAWQLLTGSIAVLPAILTHFFNGAPAAIFGYAQGGKRGALLGSFLLGLVTTLLTPYLLPYLGQYGQMSITFGSPDFIVIGILVGVIIY